MKKINKVLVAGLMGVAAVTTLASCSNATESYANKINEKAEDENCVTYAQAVKALGKECIDCTINDTVLKTGHSGVLIACKGCKSSDDIQAKLDAGKEVKGVVITVVADKCTAATYRTITSEDVK